jgi:predicted MPP superfamily phosphohydrolase
MARKLSELGSRNCTVNEPEKIRPDFAGRKITRRRFVQGTLGLVATGALAHYGGEVEADNLVVTYTDVYLPRFGASADGIKIGILSDFHADYKHAVLRADRAVKLLMRQKPDIVFVLGDYVTQKEAAKYIGPLMSTLRPLANAPRGAFAIMGNHDCWSNEHEGASYLLGQAGFTVLNNASVPLPGVEGAYIVGLDDGWCGLTNVDAALYGVPSGAPKIVAIHEPDFADKIGPGFDLQLSGHSHGGQIRVPGLPVLHAPLYGRKYPEGLQQAENHLVYTTRGVGMIGPQIRTFCAPEVTMLTLCTAG